MNTLKMTFRHLILLDDERGRRNGFIEVHLDFDLFINRLSSNAVGNFISSPYPVKPGPNHPELISASHPNYDLTTIPSAWPLPRRSPPSTSRPILPINWTLLQWQLREPFLVWLVFHEQSPSSRQFSSPPLLLRSPSPTYHPPRASVATSSALSRN